MGLCCQYLPIVNTLGEAIPHIAAHYVRQTEKFTVWGKLRYRIQASHGNEQRAIASRYNMMQIIETRQRYDTSNIEVRQAAYKHFCLCAQVHGVSDNRGCLENVRSLLRRAMLWRRLVLQ
jgi:hypothetical protein